MKWALMVKEADIKPSGLCCGTLRDGPLSREDRDGSLYLLSSSLLSVICCSWLLLFADEYREGYCERTPPTPKRHKTHKSSCTVHTCTHSPSHMPTHPLTLYFSLSHSHAHRHFMEEALQCEHVNVLAVLPDTEGSCSLES